MGNSNSKSHLDSTGNTIKSTSITKSKTIHITPERGNENGKQPVGPSNDQNLRIHTPIKVFSSTTHPAMYNDHFSSLLIPHEMIQKRATELASHIHLCGTYPQNEPLVILCVLKGSSPFCHMLLSELSKLGHPYIYEFIRVKSYIGNSSSGNVHIWGNENVDTNSNENTGLPKSILGRHVLVIEDIIDTGLTLSALLPKIRSAQPKSLDVCTLLLKRLGNDGESVTDSIHINWDLVGFTIPDSFAVGFGLDYNEMYRDLLDIYVLDDKGIAHGGYGNDL